VTALVQGLAPALSDGPRLSWAAPSSLHEGLGRRALSPDRIQGDAAKPRVSMRPGPGSPSPDQGGARFVPNAQASRRARRRQAAARRPSAVTFGQARPRPRAARVKSRARDEETLFARTKKRRSPAIGPLAHSNATPRSRPRRREDRRGAEAGERRLKHVEAGEGGQQKPGGANPITERHADQNDESGESRDPNSCFSLRRCAPCKFRAV